MKKDQPSKSYGTQWFPYYSIALPSQKLLGVPVKTGMQHGLPLAQYVNTLYRTPV